MHKIQSQCGNDKMRGVQAKIPNEKTDKADKL